MSYEHLPENERYVISHLKSAKAPVREIARRIGRHHTSVSRDPGFWLILPTCKPDPCPEVLRGEGPGS
jgi:hypothetical protein